MSFVKIFSQSYICLRQTNCRVSSTQIPHNIQSLYNRYLCIPDVSFGQVPILLASTTFVTIVCARPSSLRSLEILSSVHVISEAKPPHEWRISRNLFPLREKCNNVLATTNLMSEQASANSTIQLELLFQNIYISFFYCSRLTTISYEYVNSGRKLSIGIKCSYIL